MGQERVGQERVSEFVYSGPVNPSSAATPQRALSAESARHVALSAWYSSNGRLRPTDHFKKRVVQRKFDILDFEYVLRHGKPRKKIGIFCAKFQNYKYEFIGSVDGMKLRVVFAIDAAQDYKSAPLVILITGAWNTKSGKRKR